MIYTVTTDISPAQIKKQMEAHAKEQGFPIEKEITVFELCNPPGAQQRFLG